MSISFNGTSSVIQIANSSNLNPVSFSISLLFNLKSFSTPQCLLCKPVVSAPWVNPYVTWLIRVNDSNTIETDIGNGSEYSGFSISVPSMSINTEYGVTMTFDGQVLSSYFNGNLLGTDNLISGTSYAPYPVLIGADYGLAPYSDYCNGTISNVRIYNRVLTSNEINILYTEKLQYSEISNGLIAYFPLDDYDNSFVSNTISDRTSNKSFASGSGVGVGENYCTYKQGTFYY